MKYIKLFEDFFSIFPPNRYDTLLDVNIAISNLLIEITKKIIGFSVKAGEYGGTVICYNSESFDYKAFDFDMDKQIITLHITEGRMLLSTLTFDSRELKKTLLSDIKTRFNIS